MAIERMLKEETPSRVLVARVLAEAGIEYVFGISGGHTGQAIGLAIYSAVVTGNVDYLARITLLKRIGDIHPVITVLGVIVGLKLFGFWGFIFGPLLISYFLLLCKIYNAEFHHFTQVEKK